MAAGISQKRLNAIVYRKLKALQLRLDRLGIPARYRRGTLIGDDPRAKFIVWYRIYRASNGEVAVMQTVQITEGIIGGTLPMVEYGMTNGPSSEHGVRRIIEVLGNHDLSIDKGDNHERTRATESTEPGHATGGEENPVSA